MKHNTTVRRDRGRGHTVRRTVGMMGMTFNKCEVASVQCTTHWAVSSFDVAKVGDEVVTPTSWSFGIFQRESP